MIMNILSKKTNNSVESKGYYNRIPIRVCSFALVENTESKIIYQTTSNEFCDNGPTIKLVIYKNENDWSIDIKQGSITSYYLHYSGLDDEKLSRRRAFWHACQYMKGKTMNNKERYSRIYQSSNKDVSIFKADAFFKNGNAITTDPFGEFLK